MRLRGTRDTEEGKVDSARQTYGGSLLVALPSLLDANFRRTILFLSHHEPEEGAVGFIMNRPRGENLGDLAIDPITHGLENVPVFEGGPVEFQSLTLVRLLWGKNGACFQALGVEDLTEEDFPPAHDTDPLTADSGLRAFTGHAGWSAGQLEREVAEKSWVVLPATSALLEPVLTVEEGISRWKSLMKELGPWYHLLSEAPDNPGVN